MPGNFLTATLLPTLVSAAVVWIWSIFFHRQPAAPRADQDKRRARNALYVLLAAAAILTGILALSPGAGATTAQRNYSIGDVIGQVVSLGIIFAPMLVGVKIDHLTWPDLQFRRRNAVPSLALGTLIGLIYLGCAGKFASLTAFFTIRMFWAGLQFLIIGFAEETCFRGYIQGRWVNAFGWWAGWLLSSLAFGLFHFPILLLAEKRTWVNAGLEVLRIIPLSLLLGYTVRKCDNIIGPSIIHFWLNWIQAI